jgi:hypothetical protein
VKRSAKGTEVKSEVTLEFIARPWDKASGLIICSGMYTRSVTSPLLPLVRAILKEGVSSEC